MAAARSTIERPRVESKRKPGDFVFTAADIAREGPAAIDQSRYPNCWFESSMSALAGLPRGQRLIAGMIKYGIGNQYVVRFPGDGVEYIVTDADLDRSSIKDKALWASIIECAQIKKFPENAGAFFTCLAA